MTAFVPNFETVEGDTLEAYTAILSDDTGVVDVTGATTVQLVLTPVLGGATIILTGSVLDGPSGQVTIVGDQWATVPATEYTGRWRVVFATGEIGHFPDDLPPLRVRVNPAA